VVTTDYVSDLVSLKTEISLAAREGRLPKLTADQLRILKAQVVPRGNEILKWFSFEGQTLSVEPIFDKRFISELRNALQKSAASGNQTAAKLLTDLNWG